MTATKTFTVQARVGAARRAATRERILDAARRLLEGGDTVAELTVARLAEEAEVSRATFYLHFPDKRHLVEALHADALQGWEAIAGDALSDPEITREGLYEVLLAGVRNAQVHGAVIGGIIELSEYDAEFREVWRENIQAGAVQHTAWIARSRPDLSARQVKVLGEVLGWAGERSIHRMTGVRDEPSCDAEELADALTELWWCVTHPAS